MRKWALTIVLAAAAGVATWLSRWPPHVWRAAVTNRETIGLATDLVSWALWIAAALSALLKVWGAKKPPPGEQQDHITAITDGRAGRDQIAADGDAQTGGVRIEGSVGGDAAGGDITHGDTVGRDKIIMIQQAAAGATPTRLHQLPPPPADFTGREEELEELRSALTAGGVTISGVAGMGGIGKTALALKLADQLTSRCPDAQIYLDLKGTSPQPLISADAMAHVIRSFHSEATLPEDEEELRGLYHSTLNGKRALLLMDNAADAQQVRPLIPCDTCVLLVTSRQYFTLSGFHPKNLDALRADDARGLLLKIEPRIGRHAGTVAELCGCLPLALELAARALAEQRDLTAEEYVRRLNHARKRLELVEASLSLSHDLLGTGMQERWRALGVFPGTFDVPAAATMWRLESDAAQDSLSALVARSMVEWDAKTRRYRLHDLARLFAESRLAEDERRAAQQRHAEHYRAVLAATDELYLAGGEGILRGLALFDAERQNIRAGQGWTAAHAGQDDEAAHLCSGYPDAGAYVLSLRLHPRERISWLEAAAGAARRLKDRRAEGNHLGNLGLAYAVLGETRKAIEFHEQALAIDRDIGDRRGEGADLCNLGTAYAALGETRKAIEFHEQQLTITREIGDRRGESAALGNLAIAYAALGETRKAINVHEQALAVMRDIGDRRAEGSILGNLGVAYAAVGETRKAIEFYEEHLTITREIGDRRGEGTALGNLGNAYFELGETRKAIEFHEQQLTLTREIGDRRGEGNALWNMSLALDKLGQRGKAIANAEAALVIFEQIEDPAAEKVRRQLAEWRREK